MNQSPKVTAVIVRSVNRIFGPFPDAAAAQKWLITHADIFVPTPVIELLWEPFD